MRTQSILDDLLDQCAAFDGEYGDKLSTHLPMALVALSRLGADDSRLHDFFRAEARRLRPKSRATLAITKNNWHNHLGKHAFHTDYADFFGQELACLGGERLLATYIPELLIGVAGGAMHGLIRTAYGIDAGRSSEIVEGLAHWAVSYMPLANFVAATPIEVSESPAELLEVMAMDPFWLTADLEAPNIFSRMAKASAYTAFTSSLGALPTTDLRSLSALAMDIYGATANFTALHLVTATHALRLIYPYSGDYLHASFYFWTAFKAAYATIRCPAARLSVVSSELPEWSAIRARAVNSPDDHTIKLVYSCECEARAYAVLGPQKIAAERVGFAVGPQGEL